MDLTRALIEDKFTVVVNDPELEAPLTSSEAHLDLLLAEELAVNPEFLRWFIEPLWERLKVENLAGGDLTAIVRLNVWDGGGPDCVATDGGENDIDVLVAGRGQTLRVLIEDKVWAVFQPDQCARYQRRARSRGNGTVLVAPRSRLASTDHTDCFHAAYGIEDLADWLVDQAKAVEGQLASRLRWRAQLLRQLCVSTRYVPKPDHPPTVAFTTFCVKWLAVREPRAVPDASSLRTAGSGWLFFTTPSALVYKASHGRVDLYVGKCGFKGTADHLASAVAAGWGAEGFAAAVDTSGNPVLRFEHKDAVVYSQDGVPEDPTGVELALNAVVIAVRWIAEQGEAIKFPVA
jgi:hypothetical protein